MMRKGVALVFKTFTTAQKHCVEKETAKAKAEGGSDVRMYYGMVIP